MILDIEVKPGSLRISYFDKNGEIAMKDIWLKKEEQFNWTLCSEWDADVDKTIKSWNNKPVKKEATNRVNKYRVEEILQSRGDSIAELREFVMPKKHFIDIETEVIDGFPEPETALNRVLSISIANDQHRVFVLGLDDFSDEQSLACEQRINEHFKKFDEKWTFQYIKFESEYDMLYTFMTKLIHKMHCITGWNVIDYDWTYLVNRCERLKIKPEQSSVSGKLITKRSLPQHRLIVDYMEIYKKWDRSIKIKESNKLDYVGEQAVGINKIKYNGPLKDLYAKDFFSFVLYNAIDSAMIYYIDRKLCTMTTFLKLAHVAQVEANKAFSPIWTMEAWMTREFLKMGKVFTDIDKEGRESRDFEGAYVKDPVVGLHEYVTCYDFASLYPNTMMQFNISPEAFIGKVNKDYILKPGEILTANSTVFDNKEDSVLRKILNDLYGRRKATKQIYLSAAKEIDRLERVLG